MAVRRRLEEVDEKGQRRVIIKEEPRSSTEVFAEDEIVRSRPVPWDVTRSAVRSLSLWVLLALGVTETLLALRLGFRLAAANPNAGFVDFINDITGPMVDPFQGIVLDRGVAGDGVLESAALIAMIVFLAASLLAIAVLWTITAFRAPGHRSAKTRVQQRTHALRED